MERKLAVMIGAAALAAVGSSEVAAAPDPANVLQARSFAELLKPIPNASVLLAAAESLGLSENMPAVGDTDAREKLAYHHHHHHHHRWWRHRYHHHHHHHHHYYY